MLLRFVIGLKCLKRWNGTNESDISRTRILTTNHSQGNVPLVDCIPLPFEIMFLCNFLDSKFFYPFSIHSTLKNLHCRSKMDSINSLSRSVSPLLQRFLSFSWTESLFGPGEQHQRSNSGSPWPRINRPSEPSSTTTSIPRGGVDEIRTRRQLDPSTMHTSKSWDLSTRSRLVNIPTDNISTALPGQRPISCGANRYYNGRRQLGSLDPSHYLSEESEELYDISFDHLGRVWFTLTYSTSKELLTCILHKARNIRFNSDSSVSGIEQQQHQNVVFGIGAGLDESKALEYRFKFYLDKTEKKYRTSSIKKQTTNPNFNEQFNFQTHAPFEPQIQGQIKKGAKTLNQVCEQLMDGHKLSVFVFSIYNSEEFPKSCRIRLAVKIYRSRNSRERRSYVSPLYSALNEFIQIEQEKWIKKTECPRFFLCSSLLIFYMVSAHSIEQQTLCVQLLSIDRRHQCKIASSFVVTLSDLGLVDGGVEGGQEGKSIRMYRDLQPVGQNQTSSDLPLLQIALTYFPQTERIIVGIFDCRKLPLKENGQPIDKPLGIVVLGNDMVAKGKGIDQWQAMLDNPEQQVVELQALQSI